MGSLLCVLGLGFFSGGSTGNGGDGKPPYSPHCNSSSSNELFCLNRLLRYTSATSVLMVLSDGGNMFYLWRGFL